MLTRRNFLTAGSLAAAAIIARPYSLAAEPRQRLRNLPASLEQIERANACRLGVAVLDTGNGESSGHRADERFAMCSTFKVLLAAAVLVG